MNVLNALISFLKKDYIHRTFWQVTTCQQKIKKTPKNTREKESGKVETKIKQNKNLN